MTEAEEGAAEPHDSPQLARITARLESLARELDSEPDEQRVSELVREAAELAAAAGQEVERAVRAAAETRRE